MCNKTISKISILLIILFITNLFIFTACSNEKNESITTKKQYQANDKKASQEKNIPREETKKATTKVDFSVKKIVILKQPQSDDPSINDAAKKLNELAIEDGIKAENITNISNKPQEVDKVPGILENIKGLNPDIIFLLPGIPGPLREGLKTLNIPIATGNVEEDCDENGIPKGTLTGLFFQPNDFYGRLYEMLKKIAPLNGKKASTLVNDTEAKFMPEERLRKILDSSDVELKDYIIVKTKEDAIAAAKKLAADKDVGWALIGQPPEKDSKGKPVNGLDLITELTTIVKKPSISNSEQDVAKGILCGLSINEVYGFGNQLYGIGSKILSGKKVSEVKAEDFTNFNIIFNKKTADDFNFKIPEDLFSAAYKVYTDYNFNYIGNKK